MRVAAAFLLATLPATVFGNPEDNGCGARPISLSNAFVAVANDPWSTFYNPAGLAGVKSFRISAFFVPEQFGLRELRSVSACATLPSTFATFGLMTNQFGFELYRETTIALGVGRGLGDSFAFGMTINVVRLTIERYGRAITSDLDLGAQVDIADGVRLGFCWKNVTAAGIGTTGEPFPQMQTLGVSYDFSTSSRLLIEWEKDIRYPFSFKGGCEQLFLGFLSVRFGVSTNPDKFSFGVGASQSFVEFSYAAYSHAQLGWTHQIEISFKLD